MFLWVLLRLLGNASLEDGKHMTLRVRSSGSTSCRNPLRTKRKTWRKLLTVFTAFSMTPSLAWLLYASVIFSVYANSVASHLLAVRERERGSSRARNCTHLTKIDNNSYTIKTNLFSMPECADELSSFVKINLAATFAWQLLTTQVACAYNFLSSVFKSAAVFFFINDQSGISMFLFCWFAWVSLKSARWLFSW